MNAARAVLLGRGQGQGQGQVQDQVERQSSLGEYGQLCSTGFGQVGIAYPADAWANEAQRANLRAVLGRAAAPRTRSQYDDGCRLAL